jgi:hypothetical protein
VQVVTDTFGNVREFLEIWRLGKGKNDDFRREPQLLVLSISA